MGEGRRPAAADLLSSLLSYERGGDTQQWEMSHLSRADRAFSVLTRAARSSSTSWGMTMAPERPGAAKAFGKTPPRQCY